MSRLRKHPIIVFLLLNFICSTGLAKVKEVPRQKNSVSLYQQSVAGAMRQAKVRQALNQFMLQQRLLQIAHYYSTRDSIPYIWGGGGVANRQKCLECRRCAERVAFKSRLRCKACQECGIDCSHFVQRVYAEAGMDFPYLTTRTMRFSQSSHLQSVYDLTSLGQDISKAQPGDMLLYRKHVVMLLHKGPNNRGDVIHVSPSGRPARLGGIRIDRDRFLPRFRGPLLRILRHNAFFEIPEYAPNPFQNKTNFWLLSWVNQPWQPGVWLNHRKKSS